MPLLTRRAGLSLLPLLALSGRAVAQQAALPPSLQVAGRRLVLNGTGLRRVFLFEAFRAALYLETASHDAEAILASTQVKLLILRYSRDIPRDRLVSGWEDGFRERCACAMPDNFRARLCDLREGEEETWLFLPDHVDIAYAGERPVRMDNPLGARMLSAFIGPKAQSSALSRGLLGLS